MKVPGIEPATSWPVVRCSDVWPQFIPILLYLFIDIPSTPYIIVSFMCPILCKYLESLKMWRRMEKITRSEKLTNVEIRERIGEKTNLLNNTLHTKGIWIGHIPKRNRLLLDAIEWMMTEVKGVGRRRTQLLDDLRYRRRYWELKEKAEDRKR